MGRAKCGLLAITMLCCWASAGLCQPASESAPSSIAPHPNKPHIILGVDLLHPLLYGVGSSFVGDALFLPIDINAHFGTSNRWGIATTIGYFKHTDADFGVNGLNVLVGPRRSLGDQGLYGSYVALKLGLSFRSGNDYFDDSYYRIDAVCRPELGYAARLGQGGTFFAIGVGLQVHLPLSESSHSDWTWNGLGSMVNYAIPMANLTVGVAK